MSALSYLSPKPPQIKAVLDESPSCSWMALIPTLLGLGLTLDWLGCWLEISNSVLVSFSAATSTSAYGSGMCDVVAYSITSWSQLYDFFRSPRSVSMLVLPSILSSR
jgi:hypothetical protein